MSLPNRVRAHFFVFSEEKFEEEVNPFGLGLKIESVERISYVLSRADLFLLVIDL
jgi:hypothetical protein